MSSSIKGSKIDLIDDEKTVQQKLRDAYCPEGEVEGNGVLAFAKHVIFVLKADNGENFIITRPEKFGGDASFSTYEELEAAYAAKKVHPMDLKSAVAREVSNLLAPIRARFVGKESLIADAYPEK